MPVWDEIGEFCEQLCEYVLWNEGKSFFGPELVIDEAHKAVRLHPTAYL